MNTERHLSQTHVRAAACVVALVFLPPIGGATTCRAVAASSPSDATTALTPAEEQKLRKLRSLEIVDTGPKLPAVRQPEPTASALTPDERAKWEESLARWLASFVADTAKQPVAATRGDGPSALTPAESVKLADAPSLKTPAGQK
jgi:hypothetical protein